MIHRHIRYCVRHEDLSITQLHIRLCYSNLKCVKWWAHRCSNFSHKTKTRGICSAYVCVPIYYMCLSTVRAPSKEVVALLNPLYSLPLCLVYKILCHSRYHAYHFRCPRYTHINFALNSLSPIGATLLWALALNNFVTSVMYSLVLHLKTRRRHLSWPIFSLNAIQ